MMAVVDRVLAWLKADGSSRSQRATAAGSHAAHLANLTRERTSQQRSHAVLTEREAVHEQTRQRLTAREALLIERFAHDGSGTAALDEVQNARRVLDAGCRDRCQPALKVLEQHLTALDAEIDRVQTEWDRTQREAEREAAVAAAVAAVHGLHEDGVAMGESLDRALTCLEHVAALNRRDGIEQRGVPFAQKLPWVLSHYLMTEKVLKANGTSLLLDWSKRVDNLSALQALGIEKKSSDAA